MTGSSLWLAYALLASLFWGICYTVAGRLYQHNLSVPFVLFCETMLAWPVFLGFLWFSGSFKADMAILTNDPRLLFLLVFLFSSFVIANFFIGASISEKNATLAALIEISYPFFTFIFTWLLFREVQVNLVSCFGGILVFLGIALIYLKG